jgi:hypothetical protein
MQIDLFVDDDDNNNNNSLYGWNDMAVEKKILMSL